MSAAGESWGTGREADPLDREERDEDEQAWQAWVESPQDPDTWLNRVYAEAAWAVDYLTALCRDPEAMAVLADWDNGGTALPWTDAAPDSGNSSSDEENSSTAP